MSGVRDRMRVAAYRMQCRSRQMKFDLFWREIAPPPGSTMLNIGAAAAIVGHEHYGVTVEVEQPEQDPRFALLQIVGCNLTFKDVVLYNRAYSHRGWYAIAADACRLPFPDQSIDVIFSNAVIEHVPRELQAAMANEIMRVGRSWFVTTPNFWFPIELHRRLPLFQFLPMNLQEAYDRRFTPQYDGNPTNLLSAADMRRLFPAGRVVRQRVTFMPETLIAYSAVGTRTVR